jgi:hypothetical protein
MADHGKVQYATADGNDYRAHEATYVGFLHFAFVGTVLVINILLGLAIGGVSDHWLIAAPVILIATAAAVQGVWTSSKASSFAALAIALLAFVLTA